MRGGGIRVVGRPEYVLMIIIDMEESEHGGKQSGQGSTRFILC